MLKWILAHGGTPHYRYKVEIKATANAGFGVVGVYTQSTNTSGNSPSYTSSKTGVTTTNSTSSTKSISGISGEFRWGCWWVYAQRYILCNF